MGGLPSPHRLIMACAASTPIHSWASSPPQSHLTIPETNLMPSGPLSNLLQLPTAL